MTPSADARRNQRRLLVLDTYRQLGSIKATARTLGIDRKTIRRILRGSDQPRSTPPATQPPRPSKLDPFKPLISRLVLDDQLTVTLIHDEIRTLGYTGGHSILKAYVRTIRPAPAVTVTTRLDHPPGAPAQVDWSPHTVTLGGEKRLVHAFSLVLPFSRYMVVRYAADEQLDTLIALHDEAFAELGAVPGTITYDNMTTVGRHTGPGTISLNPRFEEYARQSGFEIKLIAPGKPNQHASVERPFHYVENNCLRRRRFTFADLADLNAHARTWCDHVANVRIHGSTRERPVDRLQRERPLLKPLPAHTPEPFRLLARQVGTDFCVAIDTNRYSVPPRHAGQTASVRLYPDRLEILVDGAIVAAHPRSETRHGRCVLPEHEAEFLQFTPSRRLLKDAFLRLGPAGQDFYDGLLAQRGQGAGYHLQRILKLTERHGHDKVIAAMTHAARYGSFSAESVSRILAGRTMPRPTHPSTEPPERVKRWLEGLDVETGDLADYDRLVDLAGPMEHDHAES